MLSVARECRSLIRLEVGDEIDIGEIFKATEYEYAP